MPTNEKHPFACPYCGNIGCQGGCAEADAVWNRGVCRPHINVDTMCPEPAEPVEASPPRTDPTPMDDERSSDTADDIRREIAEIEHQIQSAELDLIEAGGRVPGSFQNMATESRILRLRDRAAILRYQLSDISTRKDRTEHERANEDGQAADTTAAATVAP